MRKAWTAAGVMLLAASLSLGFIGQASASGKPGSPGNPIIRVAGERAIPVRPNQGFPAFRLCSDSGRQQTSGCLRLVNDSTVGGTNILTSALSATHAEQWGVVLVNVAGCGTHVIGNGSGACPFAFGSGLNSGKNGDPIVQIQNVNLNCLGFDSAGFSVGKTTCGTNNTFTTVFVQDHSGFGYISVPISDAAGSYQWLTRIGADANAQALPFQSANSSWGVVN